MSTLMSNPLKRGFTVKRGRLSHAHAILMYGTGGIGKTTLACSAPGAIIIDIANETAHLDVPRINTDDVTNWADLRALIQSDSLDGAGTIVLENASRAQEWCAEHVCKTVPKGKGGSAKSLKDYGFGDGYAYLCEEWKRLLSDFDRHRNAGRNIVLVAHENTGKVPNPSGEDYIRYEPRLYHDNKHSVMMMTKEWADHVLFISYDVAASEGRAKGSGTRTIYPTETATHIAKNRNLTDADAIPYPKGDKSLWDLMKKIERAPEL